MRVPDRVIRWVLKPIVFTAGLVPAAYMIWAALNSQLASSAQALQSFASNPVVLLGLEDFAQTLEYGQPFVAGLAPAQAYCNYLTLTFRNVASLRVIKTIAVGELPWGIAMPAQ